MKNITKIMSTKLVAFGESGEKNNDENQNEDSVVPNTDSNFVMIRMDFQNVYL